MRGLSARGSPMERAFPFGIVRQLFEPVLAVGAGPRSDVFAGPASRVERLLAGDGEPADSAGPVAVYHGLYWLAANMAATGPPGPLGGDPAWSDPPPPAPAGNPGRGPA